MTDDTYDRLITATNRAIDGSHPNDALRAYGLDPKEVDRWSAALAIDIVGAMADYTVVDVEGHVVDMSDPAMLKIRDELMLQTALVAGIELGRSEARRAEDDR